MRRFASNDETMAPVLGGFSYVVLVILDLVTTTVLLRGWPERTAEANGLMASVIHAFGFEGMWLVKMVGAFLALALYVAVRLRHPSARYRRVADAGLVTCCVVQGAIVLVNLAGFVSLWA